MKINALTPASLWLSTGRAVILTVLAALILRLLFFQQATDYPLLFIQQLDEQYYLDWARRLLAPQASPQDSTLFMDPLYAWLLAALLALFNNADLVMRGLQVLADCATAALLVVIGERLWNISSGLLAGLLYAAYPVSWFYSLTLLKTTFTTFSATLSVWLLISALLDPTIRRWLMLGALIGATVFLRANLAVLVPLVILVMAVTGHWRNPSSSRHLAAFILGTVVSLASGGVANQLSTGSFAILPATGGTTFYSVHNPENPGGGYLPPSFIGANNPKLLAEQYRNEAQRREGREMIDEETSGYWRQQALNHLFSSTDVIPTLLISKLAQLFGHAELPNNHSINIASEYIPMLPAGIPVFTLALGLGIPGLILGIRMNRNALALLPPLAMVLITSLLYYSSARFRLPVVPMLLLGAGLMLDQLFRRRWTRSLPPVATALLITAVSLSIPPLPGNRDQVYLNLARAHARSGQPERASEMLARTDSRIRNTYRYQHAVGDVAIWAEDYDNAWAIFSRLSPERADDENLVHNAALAALRSNRPIQALALFERARKLTGSAEYNYWLGETFMALQLPVQARQQYAMAVAQGHRGARYVVQSNAALLKLTED